MKWYLVENISKGKGSAIMDFKQLGLFAQDMIKQAGKLILDLKGTPLQLEEKKSFSDLVTIVDKSVEEFLVTKILEKYPNHGILGEEGFFKEDIQSLETIWIVDPIDGTTNFIQEIPYYAISIGIMHKGEEIMGLVYNPITDELFFAQKGNGAFLNNQPLKLENPLSINEAVISTSMFWEDVETKSQLSSAIINIYHDTRGLRMLGGAALGLCDVARGRLNAYIMPMLSAWDFAAGKVILQEAGGIVTRLNGEDFLMNEKGSVIATHPDIHEDILSYFNDKKKRD